jgi:hypothetical protein
VVGDNGIILTSTNGTSWTVVNNPYDTNIPNVVTPNNLKSVTWDGYRFLAVGDIGTVVLTGCD